MTKQTSTLWNELFEEYKILDTIEKNGYFDISAEQIRKKKEPRLMVKFDEHEMLPEIFQENNLSIIPVARGKYRISRYNPYYNIDNVEHITEYYDNNCVYETLNIDNIRNESSAILFAQYNGIFEKTLGVSDLKLTFYGRAGTDTFSFHAKYGEKKEKITVDKVQIEVDAILESDTTIVIIEAKNHSIRDINIRQLYYPYRHWLEKNKKEIKLFYFTHSNDSFNVIECGFSEIDNIDSFFVKREIKYRLNEPLITLEQLFDLPAPNDDGAPNVPFPQANSLGKVLELITKLRSCGSLKSKDIAELFDFEPRQAQYYANAARYIGLVEKVKNSYVLSKDGLDTAEMSSNGHLEVLIRHVLSRTVYYNIMQYYKEHSEKPTVKHVMDVIKDVHPSIGTSTLKRRAEGALSWISWIISNVDN